MNKRRFSILLVPEDNGDIKRLRVTSTQLRSVVVCLSLLLVTTAVLAIQYLGRARDAVALSQLRRENSYLRAQVVALDNSVSEFRVQMGELVEKEKTLRTMADLPEIDPDIRKVGVGGQSFEDFDGPPMLLDDPAVSPSFVLEDLDQLLRQAKLEKQSFQEVEAAFRENRDRLEHTPTIWPVDGYISRGFGPCLDPFTGQRRSHEGIDIVNRVGTPVMATAAGTIVEKGWNGGYGWMVVVDHGYGYRTAYGHLDSIKVKRGVQVKRGQVIATLGNSGRSTGPHLHYEVRVNGQTVNPLKFILPDLVVD